MKIKATIYYTIKKTHPDMKYIRDWYEGKQYSFTDIYTIKDGAFYGDDDMMGYIKRDLRLVAGGGYNSDHISNVKFDIEKL